MSEENKAVNEINPEENKPADGKKNLVKTTAIKSATALLCCATLAFTSTSIAGRVCDNKKELAASGNGTSASASADAGTGDIFADSEAALGDETTGDVTGGDVAADDSVITSDDASGSSSADVSSGSSAGSSSGSSSSGSSSSKAAAKEITLTSGLQSTNKAEVLKYYKLVAAKNQKGSYATKMTMTSLDGGSGAVGGLISAFKPIATSALEKNSTVTENIPSNYDKILESDWEKAVAVNDGTYTTLTIQLKNQKDGANGKSGEGTVGRTVAVLDGVQTALDNLPGVSADFAGSNFYLLYDNAYVKVKVKNSTGEFVKGSCTWHYRVNVNLDNLTVKVTIVSATLKGGKGTIDYTVTY